ncbi:MAG TPA: hypothetical protein VHO05_18115 [Hyphomicrobium sp.]|nr:hypothetical protein [Hyphomicrobium sp.]
MTAGSSVAATLRNVPIPSSAGKRCCALAETKEVASFAEQNFSDIF